jgi:hypothetical protein
MEPRLKYMLGELEALQRGARLRSRLAECWGGYTFAILVLWLLYRLTGWDIRLPGLLVLASALGTAGLIWWRENRRPMDLHAVAEAIEREHPELRHLVTTAAEQAPNRATGEFGFLQLRVIEQVLLHTRRESWVESFQRKRSMAATAQAFALITLLVVLGCQSHLTGVTARSGATWLADNITVTPGDTQVERGTGLVVTARFGATSPADATLVVISASGKTLRLPMARQLADPVFGASLPEIAEAGLYRVEYGTQRTRDYKIGVYDFPALTRADASLHYPEYTGLTNQTIRDTLRVSAVEGTRLTYTLLLNKAVASARLIGKTATLALEVDTNPVATLNAFPLTNSARYSLELVDADGRTNKFPAEFSLVALPDRPPVVKVDFPRGDQRVSSLQELEVEGEAKGEFGLLQYGIGYSVGGAEPRYVTLGQTVPANVKSQFTNQLAMESLGVEVDQLVSYFAWADDHGPDGKTRRTFSDMFFAEVRPFEEIFRNDQSGESENQNQNQGGQGGGNQRTKLADLQKQIVIATWKLQQERESATTTTGATSP